jgi:hypothetical protein
LNIFNQYFLYVRWELLIFFCLVFKLY